MQYQLRIYKIKPGTMAEFIDGWKTHVIPIRESFGFAVEGAWTNEALSEFVWLVSYAGEEGYEAANAVYYASDARKSMTWDPMQYIEHMDVRVLNDAPGWTKAK